MKTFKSRTIAQALCFGLAAAPLLASQVAAQEPVRALRDVENLRTDDASARLSQRGFVRQSGSGEYQNWWNNEQQQCLSVRNVGGRVASVVSAPSIDCGHSRPDGHTDAKAAAAIGAAAILAVAVLAHKSHHHDDKEHSDSAREEADYERGYRDALHGYASEEGANGAYSDGYGAGLRERSAHVPWRQGDADRSQGSQQDLVGIRASSADGTLRERGFVDRDAQIRDGRSIVTWWNAQSRTCLHVATENGRISSVRSVNAQNCR